MDDRDGATAAGRFAGVARSGAVVLVVAAAVAWLFRGFWTSRFFLAGHDTFSHDYLMWQWGWRAVFLFGRVPWWNPYLFGGWPFVASFAFCPFYPPAWFSVAFPTSLALTTQYALHLALGAVGFYAFARAAQVRPAAAFAAAVWYLAAGHVTSLANPGHLAKVQAIAWLPWAMASAARLVATGRARWALGLGACWAMQLLASHAQIFYATAGLSGLYVLGGAVFCRDAIDTGVGHVRRRVLSVILVGLAGMLALGFSAAQMLPAWEMARQSNRGGGLGRETALHGAMPPADVLEALLPSWQGDSTGRLAYDLGGGARVTLGYTGAWNGDARGRGAERVVSDYLGVCAIVFALVGLCFSRRRSRWFFVGMAVLTALVVVGDATPVWALAYRLVPGFAFFRSPGTLFVIVHLSVFALAALGVEAALDRLGSGEHGRARLVGVCIGVGCVAWGAALRMVASAMAKGVVSSLNAGAERLAREQIATLSLSHALGHVGLWLLVGGLLGAVAAWAGLGRRRWVFRAAALALVFAGLLDGFTHVRRYLPRDATARIENYLEHHFVEDAILARAHGAPLPTSIEAGRELNCRPMMRGVRSIHGYHPVVLGEYDRLIVAAGGFLSETTARLFSENFRVMPGSAAAPEGWRARPLADGRALHERIEQMPLAWVPGRVEALGKRWADLDTSEWSEPLRRVAGSVPAVAIADGDYAWRRDGASASVRVSLPSPGRMLLASAPAASDAADDVVPCVVSVPSAPGWRARFVRMSDAGEPETGEWLEDWPRRCNGFILLAPLRCDGATVTELAYMPRSAAVGLGVTVLAVLGAVCGLVWLAVRQRRKRGSQDA